MKSWDRPKIIKSFDEKQNTLKQFWGNVFHVFKRDLKRIFTKPLLIFVFIGALFLPCLYAWLTITANWDPYGNTGNLKVALVNEDAGVDSTIGGHLAVGDELEKQLSDNKQLGWTFMNKDDAFADLESGKVYATIVLPSDFSNNIAKIFTDANNKDFAKAQYYVNERENGAAIKITDTGASTIEKQINEKFVGKVTEVVATKVVELTGALVVDVANGGNVMSDRVNRIATNVSGLNNVIQQGQGTIYYAQGTLTSAKNVLTDVKIESNNLNSLIDESKKKADQFQDTIIQLIKDYPILADHLSELLNMITDVKSSLNDISATLYTISFSCDEIISQLNEASLLLNETNTIGVDFSNKLTKIHDVLIELSSIIQANLTNAPEVVKALTNANAQTVGTFMSQPVKLNTIVLNPIENNGTGISPFFTNLALWVLGIVLIALFRTEVEPPKRKYWNAKQAYVARAMLFSVGAIISAIFVSCGNLFIGIQCENPGLYVLTCVLCAIVYVNIIYMLAACFKHVGRAIACILVIMQIPGSSGMFPIQLMPEVFQNIFPFLPFTYGINALRECIINIDWMYWVLDIVALAIFFTIFFVIGLYAREGLRGINKLFDEELAKNTIMICDDQDHVKAQASAVESVVESLSDQNQAITISKAIDIVCEKYKKKSRYGLAALIIGPTLMLIIMSIIFAFVEVSINTKLVWMMIWMLAVIGSATYVIVNEYKYKQFKKQELSSLMKVSDLKAGNTNA